MFLSVIIPVYNVKAYLVRCVESVVSESQGLLCEILLIDDGSTDGSGNLCDELAGKYPGVRALHKRNGGLSDARNYGTERAVGEYIFYLDSDDYLEKGGLQAEIEAVRLTGSDVVCGNFYYKYDERKVPFDSEASDTICLAGGEEALRVLIQGKRYQNFAWGKLIHRELATKYPFPLGKLFEDTYWFHHILHEAKRVAVVGVPVVCYEQRGGSISFEYRLKSLDILDGYAERLAFLEANYPSLVAAHKRLMSQNCIDQVWMVCRRLRGRDYDTAVRKIRQIITDCRLQENVELEASQRKKLRLIMKSIAMYKWRTVCEKILKRYF